MKFSFRVIGLQAALIASSQALIISLNPTPGIDPNALSGFQLAANYWQSKLADNVTVNIDVSFSTLGQNVLGEAGSTSMDYSVAAVLAALSGDATTATDTMAISNLPTLSGSGGMNFFTQVDSESGSLVVSLDDDDSRNNLFLSLNTANAKALGLLAPNGAGSDADITFNSDFSWDFDQSDGVGAGLEDFVGVAIHEIGHALGFVSGVDTVDFYIFEELDFDTFAVFSTLDLFRYSDTGVLDFAAGSDSYFSLDGGFTDLGLFSTGSDNGDGAQASHWKDGLGLGIMDPSANPTGEINTVSGLDLIAFDVIGWNLIPEPSTALLGVFAAMLACVRRRR